MGYTVTRILHVMTNTDADPEVAQFPSCELSANAALKPGNVSRIYSGFLRVRQPLSVFDASFVQFLGLHRGLVRQSDLNGGVTNGGGGG